MSTHQVLYDPEELLGAELPLDREVHENLVRTVLAWPDPRALEPDAYHQIGLLLSGAGHAVAADVRERAAQLPADNGKRLFAEIVLGEAAGRLSEPSRSLHGIQHKARMIRALYERLDRLHEAAPASS